MHPLARCVLKVIASSLCIILASERFHWHAVLLDSRGILVLQTAQYAIQLPTKGCHSPSSSTRIRSSITLAADFQHTPKGIQGGDQEQGTVLWEKLAEQGFRELDSFGRI